MIINMKTGARYDVRIDRGSPFGNPFSHQSSRFSDVIKVATRTEAIERYREWLLTPEIELRHWKKPTDQQIRSLRNLVLGCWCRPPEGFMGRLLCHGQILAGLANDVEAALIE